MDIYSLRILITVLSFAAFLGICWWAFSGRTARAFREASELPFREDDAQAPREARR